jgi:hypothetical protein
MEMLIGGSWRPAAARGVLDVLAGREPQTVANPAWRTHRITEMHP